MKPNILEQIAAETILYGGLVCTRREAYDDALEQTGDWKAADAFAFGPRVVAVDPESVKGRTTLAEVKAKDKENEPFREWCGKFLEVYRARVQQDFREPWESLRKYFNCNYLPESVVYELTGIRDVLRREIA